MQTILVTGGSGFIGSHTSLVLLEKGFNLVILDSHVNSSKNVVEKIKRIFKKNSRELSEDNLFLIDGDIRDEVLLNEIFSNYQKKGNTIHAVIHFAGLKAVADSVKNPLEYWENNVYGSLNLFKSMQKFNCKTIVFSSSATVYGNPENNKINENSIIQPINPYGETKAAIEKILNGLFMSDNEWRIANLRYFNPTGAHPSGLIGEDPICTPNNLFPILNKVAQGEVQELKIYGNDWPTKDGTGVRDYIHVMDLADGHALALDYLLRNSPQVISINLGTGKGTSVLELLKKFVKINNVKVPYQYVDRRKGDIATCIADNSLACSLFGWEPQRTLEEMCIDSWRWQCNVRNFL